MTQQHTVVVTDCDHAAIDIEKQVLADICDPLPWLRCRTEDDVIRECRDAEGLIIQYAPLSRRVIAELPKCKVMARYGVGVDTIDLAAAKEKGIVVCNVPDYGVEEVSDHALALMFALSRKIVAGSSLVKRGVWDYLSLRPVFRHREQTVGIIGIGRIGAAFARKIQAIGMKTLAFDPWIAKDGAPAGVTMTDLDTLLQTADVVSLHCPLTDQTRNLIDDAKLRLMKPTAYLINTARGHIVNEAALDLALAEKRLAGAAFDVLAAEPPPADLPLFRHDNFLCTPHLAWHSTESAQELKRKAAEEVRTVLLGQTPRYRVV